MEQFDTANALRARDLTFGRAGFEAIIDRTIRFNCLRLGAIHALMPNAKIIHCQRDPVDTCLSIYANLLKSRVSFAARKDDLAFCYRQYLRVMEHWRKVLPADNFMEVQYEPLIADREAETRRLTAFAGLDWNNLSQNCHRAFFAAGTTTRLRHWIQSHSRPSAMFWMRRLMSV
ncbi:MAG TPA: sulfotransferase [Rhizomicrobium sp.]|jgi:hypothetical protein|nr:sulfotransferase [Rhizomicrobium sp.]